MILDIMLTLLTVGLIYAIVCDVSRMRRGIGYFGNKTTLNE